jgi:hypothetical protein
VTTWEDLELGWEETAETEETYEFIPDRAAEVIDIKKGRKSPKFNAEVFNGGKQTDED